MDKISNMSYFKTLLADRWPVIGFTNLSIYNNIWKHKINYGVKIKQGYDKKQLPSAGL